VADESLQNAEIMCLHSSGSGSVLCPDIFLSTKIETVKDEGRKRQKTPRSY